MFAFDVQPFQIAGGPAWMHTDRYDIVAKPPASSESSRLNPPSTRSPLSEEQRQMLQSLLIDRFQLKFHREDRTGSVFVLAKGRGELKLQPPKDEHEFSWAGSNAGGAINGDGLAGKNISMPQFAVRLSRYLQRPVLDKTGLKGSFDFKYENVNDDPGTMQDVVTSILTSVVGLGLKLESAKGPVDTIVVDHVEKPSEN